MMLTHTLARGMGAVLFVAAFQAAWGAHPLLSDAQVSRVRQGISEIYSLEHARAIEIFQEMIRDSPDDPLGYAYLAKTYWLQELVTKQELSIDRFAASDFFVESPKYRPVVDPAAEQRFLRANEQAITKARARLEESPDDRAVKYALGLAYQNRASFEASLKRSWWSSYLAGSKAYDLHVELLQRDRNLYDAYLTTGVFHYVKASLPWSVRWLAVLLGYPGSKEEAKQELRAAAEYAPLAADDARVILTLIHTREKNLQAAFDELQVLLKKYPKNYLVHLDMGGLALLMDRPAAAVLIYQDILQKTQDGDPKYRELERAAVHNRLGVAFREAGDLDRSVDCFRQALAQPDRSILARVVAHLELGKTFDELRRRGDAIPHYRAVLNLQDFAGSREEAQNLLKNPFRKVSR